MAKQTILNGLLKGLAACAEKLFATGRAGSDRAAHASAYVEYNQQQKRIFSFFDQLQAEVDAAKRDTEAMRKQRDEAMRQLQGVVVKAAPLTRTVDVVVRPFNKADAAAGKPIEVLVGLPGIWRDAAFHGINVHGYVIIEYATGAIGAFDPQHVRMKVTHREQQFYANVYLTSAGVTWGTLSIAPKSELGAMKYRTVIARNVPVSITVSN